MDEYNNKWQRLCARFCLDSRQNGVWGKEPDANGIEICCLRAADFDYKRLCFKSEENFALRTLSAAELAKGQVKQGDILVEKSGGGEKVPVGRALQFTEKYDVAFSNFLERQRVNTCICNPRFYFFWWTALYQQGVFTQYIKQTTGIQNLDTFSLLANESIYLPSLKEQRKITNAIDTELTISYANEDTIQQQLDVLQRYRASIIHEAVTRGLDPNAEMKPSGVDWIGDIPAGWSEYPLKYSAHFRSDSLGANTNPNYRFKYIDISSVKHGKGITGYQYLTFNEAPSRAQKKVKNGDTIISTVRTYLKSIALIKDDIDVIVSTGFAVLEPIAHEARFLEYLLESDLFCDEIEKYSWGIAYPAISEPLMGKIHVPVPPMPEQQKIADYLDERCSVIDSIIDTKQRQLDILKRRRSSLVFEYVTGKRRVS